MNNKEIIRRIETSLIEFSLGHVILPDSPEKYSLSDRMSNYNIPGLSLAVINDYEIDWAKCYGVLKNGTENRVEPNSIFQACSISKMVTTPLIMHLIENGTFDLDTDVNTYLQSWKVPESEFSKNCKVTLRGLLTHQSGVSRPTGGYNWEKGTTPTLVQILNGEYPAVMKPTVVEFEPFSKWQYSNMGFAIIQLLLEEHYGKPYHQISQEMLLAPLGMKDSTFKYPLSDEWAKREISLHDRDGNPTYPGIIPTAEAHGGLMTTPTDLAKFGIALMRAYQGDSAGILTPSLAKDMMEQKTWIDDISEMGLPFGMGFGCFMVGEGESKIVFHHGGNDPGASSLLIFMPERGFGAAFLANGLSGVDLSLEILAAIAHEYGWEE
ncbi:MAG: beta-lactamase family protein [Anaerolineaceae bacterium]|nr:beta-lactamase family protein [Anaerolineaceae bacterium]